jgi:CheY-like chemotaxis protein
VSISILLADDQPLLRLGFRLVLDAQEDMKVVGEAGDGAAALRQVREEEEQDWFPKVRAGLGRKQLQEIGTELEQARQKAPTTPAQPSALRKAVDAVIA